MVLCSAISLAFSVVLLEVIDNFLPCFYLFLSVLALIDEDADQIENRVEHVLMIFDLLSFEQLHIQYLQIFIEIDDPAVVIFLNIFEIVEQKLKLSLFLIVLCFFMIDDLILLQQYCWKLMKRDLNSCMLTGPGKNGK